MYQSVLKRYKSFKIKDMVRGDGKTGQGRKGVTLE